MIANKHLLPVIFLCLGFTTTLFTQNIVGVMDVNGRLTERVAETSQALPGVGVYVSNMTEQMTDQQGAFSFRIPIYKKESDNPEITIGIKTPSYQMLHPMDGIVALDTTHWHLMLELIVVRKGTDSDLLKKVEAHQRKIRKLERNNNLSRSRMNALNKVMIDTIQYFENLTNVQQLEIQELEKAITEETEENKKLKDQLLKKGKEINRLRDSIAILTNDLYDALEAKYLRQQKIFEEITVALNNYLVRVKDLKNLMPKVKQYFSGGNNYAASYNKILEAYNVAFLQINDHYDSYLESVDRYWKTDEVRTNLKKVFDQLLQTVHHPEIKPGVSEINSFIYARKAKKAERAGKEISNKLTPLLTVLEKDIKLMISELRKNI